VGSAVSSVDCDTFAAELVCELIGLVDGDGDPDAKCNP
jgi:hypothetical protein